MICFGVMQNTISWDDLAIVLAIGRAGTLAGAARDLKLDHSTVFRRIGTIEERLGTRLFDRRRDGYHPTKEGDAAIEVAARIQDEVITFQRRLAGADLRPSGVVRFTTSETLLPIVSPILRDFLQDYPEISLEIATGSQNLDLSRRDADVALRFSREPSESLHGRRVSSVAFAVYGPQGFAHESYLDIERWVGLDETLSHLRGFAWLNENVASSNVVLRASSFVGLLQATVEGVGASLLPCYMGDTHPALVRLSPIIAEVATDLWLLVHPDIRKTARVKGFTDYLYAALTRKRSLFDPDL